MTKLLVVIAVSGCDYVLGLQERHDASLGDGPRDDTTMPVDDFVLPNCPSDDFSGSDVAARWELTMHPQIAITQDGQLAISIQQGANVLGDATMRSRATADFAEGHARIQLVEPAGANTDTSFGVESGGLVIGWRMFGEPPSLVPFVAGSSRPTIAYNAIKHAYLEVAFLGNEVIWRASPDGTGFMEEDRYGPITPPATGRVLLQGRIHATPVPVATTIVYDNLIVSCP